MTKPLDRIKKIRGRSVSELWSRSGQAVSVYREQIGLGPKLPTDEEFKKLVDAGQFGRSPIIAESLWQKFYKNADEHFFRSFVGDTAKNFRGVVGSESCDVFVSKAELLVDGRFDLLAFKNLFVGTEVDWHLEPISGIRSPAKHWNQFDDLNSEETGDKKIIWELNRHQHFFTLGVAYLLTGDEKYAATFVEHIESWIEQNPSGLGINWTSSLEVSFRAISWIWALHFFRHSDALTPEIFKKILKVLQLHGQHIEKYLSTYYSPNTHLTGEALGLYYLGTQLPFLLRSKHWRKLGEDILLDEATKQIHEDGVYFEQSTWYQRYTVDFYSHFFVLRSLATDAKFDPRNQAVDERYAAAINFMMHVTRPDGTTPMIGDDDGGRMLPFTYDAPNDFRGSLALGGAILGNNEVKFVAGNRRHEIFWLAGIDGVRTYDQIQPIEPAVTSKYFSTGGYCVMRDGWADTDTFLMIDCGEVGSLSGGHGHADTLSYDLALQGRTLLVDPGTYSYHDSKEMRDLFRVSATHNTVSIDKESSSEPSSTFKWKSRAEAKHLSSVVDERFDYFDGVVEGFEAVDGGALHRRSLVFLKNDYLFIRDRVETSGKHEHALNFHYAVGCKLDSEKDSIIAGDERHRIFAFGDGGEWQNNESWVSTEYGRKTNAPYLRFVSKGKGVQEFFTFIIPSNRGFAAPDVTEMPIIGGRAFVIKYTNYTDVLIASDGNREVLETEILDSNFELTWARLSAGETRPDEIVAISGNRLAIAGVDMFEGVELHNSAVVRRLGRELFIRSDGELGSLSLD